MIRQSKLPKHLSVPFPICPVRRQPEMYATAIRKNVIIQLESSRKNKPQKGFASTWFPCRRETIRSCISRRKCRKIFCLLKHQADDSAGRQQTNQTGHFATVCRNDRCKFREKHGSSQQRTSERKLRSGIGYLQVYVSHFRGRTISTDRLALMTNINKISVSWKCQIKCKSQYKQIHIGVTCTKQRLQE